MGERRLSDRSFAWPEFPSRPAGQAGPFRVRLLRESEAEFEAVAEVFGTAYPALEGTGAGALLSANGCASLLAGPEGFMTGRARMLVVAGAGDRPVGALLLKADPPNLSIFWVVAAVRPGQRRRLLGPLVRAADELTSDSGAEYAYAYAVTHHRATQRALARIGFQGRGLLPGAFLAATGGGRYHRETVLYMDKLYGGAEDLVGGEVAVLRAFRGLLPYGRPAGPPGGGKTA
jgi:hypothetical protein